jgi:hypothetical protein
LWTFSDFSHSVTTYRAQACSLDAITPTLTATASIAMEKPSGCSAVQSFFSLEVEGAGASGCGVGGVSGGDGAASAGGGGASGAQRTGRRREP